MKLAIMQPYFMPYIGYFQLIASVDLFIIYDNIKYTKKGWINRNRILQNGKDSVFSIPLKKASDSNDIVEREISGDFDRTKLLNQFKGAYSRAPYFEQTFPLLQRIVSFQDTNLFSYIHNSITEVCHHIGIDTKIRISSSISIDHEKKAQEKVLELCGVLGAETYINPMGGVELYDKNIFYERGVCLKFIQPKAFEYKQFESPFVPWLSIVDILMFNSRNDARDNIFQNFEYI